MTAIINEVSGERAMQHVLEFVPYRRVRLPSEYEGKDVRGKVVVSSGSIRTVCGVAIERGAVGAMGISVIGPERAIDFPRQIVSTSVIAARVLNDNMGRGLAGLGNSHTKGLGYLAVVTDEGELNVVYREALNAIRHQVGVEQDVVWSASVMWTDADAGTDNR